MHTASEAPWYDDVDVPMLVTVGVVGGAITVATLFACVGVYNLYKSYDYDAKAAVDQAEGKELLAVQAEGLTRYAIVDAAKDQYQIPIDQAMKSVVEEFDSRER